MVHTSSNYVNDFHRFAGTCPISQMHFSLHIRVLLVKFKIMYLNTFLILHLDVRIITI
jgi:hypothetical protein